MVMHSREQDAAVIHDGDAEFDMMLSAEGGISSTRPAAAGGSSYY